MSGISKTPIQTAIDGDADVKNFHIRDARPEELDEVSELLHKAYQQYQKLLPAAAWNFYLENITDVRSRLELAELIVAELDGHLVGTVTLYLKSPVGSPEGWPAGWAGIRLLAVSPEYRGRGIGQALMAECIRRCRRHNIVTIGLHTTKMMDVARRMYESMGFKRVPEFDFRPRPDTLVMAYRLDLRGTEQKHTHYV